MANLSFEIPGTTQGSAQSWAATLISGSEALGIFNADGLVSWDYIESFEKGFYLPYHVHGQADSISITAPNATNWATAYTLLADIADKYEKHCLTSGNIHLRKDYTWVRYVWAPDSPDEAMDAANTLREAIYSSGNFGFPRGHLVAWPLVHRKGDFVNIPTSPPATDETSTVNLTNELKIRLNAHFILIHYGLTNEASKFAFEDSDLDPGLFGDSTYESFEHGWSIADLVPIFIADQRVMVAMDVLATSWLQGHVEFLGNLDYVATEHSPLENFEFGFLLPGSSPAWPNDKFKLRYYDGALGHFRFTDIQLEESLFENFESGWKQCEIGKNKYWDGTKWRFKEDISPPDRQLEPAGFGDYLFAEILLTGWATLYATIAPQYSPRLQATVTEAVTSPTVVYITFLSEVGAWETVEMVIPASPIGTVLSLFTKDGETGRFEKFFGGIQEIISLACSPESTGKLEFRGSRTLLEQFDSSDWTLNLDE